jgi:hypothetical protein
MSKHLLDLVISFITSAIVSVFLAILILDMLWLSDELFFFVWLFLTLGGTMIFFVFETIWRASTDPSPPIVNNAYQSYNAPSQQYPVTNENKFDDLKKLGELRDEKLLSEEEYQREKDKLLNS